MKKLKKTLAIVMAVLMAFSMLTATAAVSSAASVDEITSTVTGYIGIAEKIVIELNNFFVGIKYFFQRLSGASITVAADDASDFSVADTGDTISLTKDIATPNVTISKAVNINLNGHTLTCNTFTYKTDTYANAELKNGKIIAKTGNIEILAPQATVNITDLNLVIIHSDTQKIIIDASKNTAVLDGNFHAIDANENSASLNEAIANGSAADLNIKGETRVTVSSKITKPVSIVVAGADVTVENHSNALGNSIVVADTAMSDVSLVNNGTLKEIAIQSTGTTVVNNGILEGIEINTSDVILENNGTLSDVEINRSNVTMTNKNTLADVDINSSDVTLVNGGSLAGLDVDSSTVDLKNDGTIEALSVVSNDTKSDVDVINNGDLNGLDVNSSSVDLENNGSVQSVSVVSNDTKSDVSVVNNGDIGDVNVSGTSTYNTGSTETVLSITNNGTVDSVTNETGSTVVVDGTQPEVIDGKMLLPWDGVTLTEIAPIDGKYYINEAREFAWVAQQINAGAITKGEFYLTSDIDLNGKEWTPIGTSAKKFTGKFDGCGYVINNLKVTRTEANVAANNSIGLFGVAQGATITNFTIKNADTSGSLYVASVLGYGISNTISNIDVTGNVSVKGWWYCGTLLGNGYSKVANCNVDAEAGSSVSISGGYAGGIIGFGGEGTGIIIDNCTSNINVIGHYNGIGGLIGILHYGNTVRNSSCSGNVINVAEEPEERAPTGGICGTYGKSGTQVATIDNCTFTGTVMQGEEVHENNASHPFYGCAYSSSYEGTIVIK